jgi:hypothetical protein
MKIAVFTAILALAAGIYNDDHWDFSTKMTVDTFDAKVKEEVDAGKTLFVRWIASAG